MFRSRFGEELTFFTITQHPQYFATRKIELFMNWYNERGNQILLVILYSSESSSIPLQPEEVWDKMINVALKGVFLCSKYAIPHMMTQKKGVILNTATVDAIVGSPGNKQREEEWKKKGDEAKR
jgi:NAD(P)-dependent dehydrogenase (short-subunit alcohol dehydrogenase family)